MKLRIIFLNFIFLFIIFNISLSNQSQNFLDKRKLQDSEYQPIRILIDTSITDTKYNEIPLNDIYWALGNCTEVLSELIKVKRITEANKIQFDFSQQSEYNISNDIINGTLLKGISNYDLILIVTLDFDIKKTETKILLRDNESGRPVLAIFNLAYKNEIVIISHSQAINFQNLFIHYLIHLLGFSYENFAYFKKNGKKVDVYETKFDDRMKLNTNYIKLPTVLQIARKYYNCQSIQSFPLENQENNTVAHWDARYLLGDVMNSYNDYYKSDQVISEFTLALLEDSGWYQVNYYTGGLMRFGKNKGCEFINNDCSTKFKNEFCEYITNNNAYGTCSSGRQSRTYCSSNIYYNYNNAPEFYRRYQGRGVTLADYCIINEPHFLEEYYDPIIGNCKYKVNQNQEVSYGSILTFNGMRRNEISSHLYEVFSDNSFCVLVSFIPNATENINPNLNNIVDIIHPMCYEMFCSENSLTIKIKEQYIVCPRQGGKIKIGGEFKGYLFCPDYNLICTGTSLCNDMYDCAKNHSSIKDQTYSYDYEIATSQIQSELKNDTILRGFEVTNKGICKIDCSQCYKNGTCIECRENYFFVADFFGQNITDIKCKEMSVSSGYYYVNSVYYPCLTNCDKCTNDSICTKCMPNYYFIGNNRTFCDTGKDLGKYYTNDDGISYFPCYTHFEHCGYCTSQNNCTKCDGDFVFIGEIKAKCEILEDKTNYFTEDEGISYLLCSNYISYCQTCSVRNVCTKCNSNFYMIGDNRAECVTGVISNFDEYYVEDELGPVYYPCDTHFNHCLTCTDKNTCTQCKDNYIFIRGERKVCFPYEEDKTYIENGNYYPCSDAFPSCDKCKSKGSCYQCLDGLYLTYDASNRLFCDDIDITKYYKTDGNIYFLCSNAIRNCDECQSATNCTKCKNGFYFLGNNRINCRNDLDLNKYYSEDNNISYYPCGQAMSQCDYCSNKSVCEKCNTNYYLYKGKLDECIKIDNIENYYFDGSSYYPCDETMTNCEKCSGPQTCYQCKNNLKIIFGEQNTCHEDSTLSHDNSLFKLNDTFYMRCSSKIDGCNTCQFNNINDITCINCQNNYFFINENRKKCLSLTNITSSTDEYIRINNTDYFTCDYKGVKNCKKCKNFTLCDLCSEDYAFVNLNYSKCIAKNQLQKGYYTDLNEIMYYSCLANCDVCENGEKCMQCKENYLSFKDNSICGICELNVTYLHNNDLTETLINKLVDDYINKNENDFNKVDLVLNLDNNNLIKFSVIIFRASECTKLVFEQNNYIEINIDELNNQINPDFSNDYVFTLINHNYKNILELYSITSSGNNQININTLCPQCTEQNYLKIKNNFGDDLANLFGEELLEEISENNYNIFDQNEQIFNDICYNLNIKDIDIPINERRNLIYLGNKQKEFLCTDNNCEIKNVYMTNSTSVCDCRINTDFNYLLSSDQTNNNNNGEDNDFIEGKKSINSFLTFKCAKTAFNSDNIKNNVGLYISLIFLVIQLVLFIVYIKYKKIRSKKPSKKIKSNPPKMGKIMSFTISDDLDDENDDDNNEGDLEKKKQKKEFNVFEEKKNYDENILDDDSEEEGDDLQNIQDKDIDSEREREIENEIKDLGGKITEENLKIEENKFKRSRNRENIKKNLLSKEVSKSRNNKLKFLEEESMEGDEKINDEELINSKNRKAKLYKSKKLYSIGSKDSLISSEINEIQNEIYQKTENIKFTDVIKQKEISFFEYYFKLLQLKQPLINLFSPIKALKLEENNIPTLVKVMRIISMLLINIFFNIFHLEQKYFRKKFEHFNDKYNLFNNYNEINISSNEIFEYAMGHAILSGFISFIICLIIQSVINIFIFNVRKKLNIITSRKFLSKDKASKERQLFKEIYLILKYEKKRYIIFFSIFLVVSIAIFYLLINFCEVYYGGILDLIAGFLWTFIFLQIIPFIYCLIFAFIRYKSIKNKNEKMYQFSQIIFF